MVKQVGELVHINGEWVIAKRLPASEYTGISKSKLVWADPKTTAFLGFVGDEQAVQPLPKHPA